MTGGTFTDDVSGNASFSIPIASPANLIEIRFAITSDSAYTSRTEFFYVDNVNVAYYYETLNNYTDADLGYKSAAGYAAVGNIVWSDADSSGTRNPGEPGIAGVTVQLFQDTDDNGTYDSGTDALWGTVTTAADGTYLITGVPASGTEDYFVYVNGAQASLTGYTRTTPTENRLYINNLGAGYVVQFANFGYLGTTYSITDRVWFDADGDGNGSPSEG